MVAKIERLIMYLCRWLMALGLPLAGVAEHVEITEGEKGLPKVALSHSCGAKAEVRWIPHFRHIWLGGSRMCCICAVQHAGITCYAANCRIARPPA